MMRINLEPHASAGDLDAVRRGLAAYNVDRVGADACFNPLHILVRDDAGSVIGGLIGATYWGWLVVEILWLDEAIRGQGTGGQLLAMAETEAIRRGCHAAHLDTMSFQALDFYRDRGYHVFGQLDDLPRGHTRYFLMKVLEK